MAVLVTTLVLLLLINLDLDLVITFMRVFQHSVTQRNATQRKRKLAYILRNEPRRSAVPQPLAECNRSSDWSTSTPEKLEVVSICFRSATRSRSAVAASAVA